VCIFILRRDVARKWQGQSEEDGTDREFRNVGFFTSDAGAYIYTGEGCGKEVAGPIGGRWNP